MRARSKISVYFRRKIIEMKRKYKKNKLLLLSVLGINKQFKDSVNELFKSVVKLHLRGSMGCVCVTY